MGVSEKQLMWLRTRGNRTEEDITDWTNRGTPRFIKMTDGRGNMVNVRVPADHTLGDLFIDEEGYIKTRRL